MINSRVPSNLLITRIAIDLVDKHNGLAEIQEKIASGKKINRPSDAPSDTAHLLSITETTNRIDQYKKNGSIAESQLALEETMIDSVNNVLMRIRELALSANSGMATESYREEINSEIKLRLKELYTLGNARDSFGKYLFSGSAVHQRPFKEGEPVTYLGNDDAREMEISLDRIISTGDSGSDVFMRIRNGNGDFQTIPSMANTGTAYIGPGSVVDNSFFSDHEYEIRFNSPNNFDIVDLTAGTTLQSNVAFGEGNNITFAGMSTTISGQPTTGDTFRFAPSSNQDIFTTVSKLASVLDNEPSDDTIKAMMNQHIDIALGDIDNAMSHLNTVRAKVGTRLNSIQISEQENNSVKLQLERSRRDVEDIDMAEAVTSLQTQANSLEILQKTFSRIEGMTLFKYL